MNLWIFSGRINRVGYIARSLPTLFIFWLSFQFSEANIETFFHLPIGSLEPMFFPLLPFPLLDILVGIYLLSLVIRRKHDCGHSGKPAVVFFILIMIFALPISMLVFAGPGILLAAPIILFIAGYLIWLAAQSGQDGTNEYGEPVQ